MNKWVWAPIMCLLLPVVSFYHAWRHSHRQRSSVLARQSEMCTAWSPERAVHLHFGLTNIDSTDLQVRLVRNVELKFLLFLQGISLHVRDPSLADPQTYCYLVLLHNLPHPRCIRMWWNSLEEDGRQSISEGTVQWVRVACKESDFLSHVAIGYRKIKCGYFDAQALVQHSGYKSELDSHLMTSLPVIHPQSAVHQYTSFSGCESKVIWMNGNQV